jgi:lysyl-tRNA synthetase class 2
MGLKADGLEDNGRVGIDWRPTASMENLRLRAEVLARIRAFFADRDVLEVETPLLGSAPVTDLHLAAMSAVYRGPASDAGRRLWLQTSPEFAMKRLLAADSGPIYQLCRAFRDGEAGSRHNPEFTILEWYRPGWDHLRLMDEVAELLAEVPGDANGDAGRSSCEKLTYAEAFQRHVGIDPHTASTAELRARAASLLDGPPDLADDRDGWLDLLLSHVIEPKLGWEGPAAIHDYPASQAALARMRPGPPPVAERFEVWVRGVELANGYHELADAVEQRRRFEADLAARRAHGLPEVPIDERLLAALEDGLPECAGVALGVDRLVMLAAGADRIDEVIAFPVDRA